MIINWPALVAEAIRRRKAEGLSQRDLAALAGVSLPTVVKFEKASGEIIVAKALAILAVLGLNSAASEPPPQT